VARLWAAPDAVTVDTTGVGIKEVFDLLMAEVKERGML
jgi:cytidylate kinase